MTALDEHNWEEGEQSAGRMIKWTCVKCGFVRPRREKPEPKSRVDTEYDNTCDLVLVRRLMKQ